MARIRSIHPSLFTDESWVSCSPFARILYIGLWTDADDQGLFEWKPLQIKMRLLPGDMTEAGALLDELAAAGLLKSYESGSLRFGAIRNFRKFQRPQKPNAIHPLPDFIAEYVGLSSTDSTPVEDHSATAPVIAPQMEDVGGRVEEKILEPTVPCPAKPNVAPDDFDKAWGAYPDKGRQRSLSKAKTKPYWRAAAKAAGGPDRLLGAIERFKREDETHKGDAGPKGFHLWLRDGRWEHWLPEARAPSATSGVDPDLFALHQRLLNGESANA